jgi:hypothetical protein
MSGVMNRRRAGAGMMVAVVVGAVGVSSVGAKSAGRADSGTVFIGETHVVGAKHFEAGSISDKLLGGGAVTFSTAISVSKPGVVHFDSKTLTFWTSTGSLTGHVSADINVASATSATVTNGKLNLTKGTGAQKGHSLVGTFTGKGNPGSTEYSFTYKASYK